MPNLAHNNMALQEGPILRESSELNDGRSGRYSFAELEIEHQQMKEPLIDGLARVGETINLIASPKVGKSWMVYDVALSVVTGREWLGFTTNKGKVLLVDNELHPPTLAKRIQSVAKALALEGCGWKQDFEVWPLRGKLKSLQELSIDINEACSKGDFKLIILDAKYRFANTEGDENSNTAEARFYNEIDRIAEITGAAILMVHHATKGSQAGKRVTDVGAGAGAQSRAADCHLVIREHEQPGAFVLDAAVRSFAPVKARGIKFTHPIWSLDTTLDATKLAGRLGKGHDAKTNEDTSDKHRILKALKLNQPRTRKDLRTATQIGDKRIQRLLEALVSDHQIVQKQTTIRGNLCYEYRLK